MKRLCGGIRPLYDKRGGTERLNDMHEYIIAIRKRYKGRALAARMPYNPDLSLTTERADKRIQKIPSDIRHILAEKGLLYRAITTPKIMQDHIRNERLNIRAKNKKPRYNGEDMVYPPPPPPKYNVDEDGIVYPLDYDIVYPPPPPKYNVDEDGIVYPPDYDIVYTPTSPPSLKRKKRVRKTKNVSSVSKSIRSKLPPRGSSGSVSKSIRSKVPQRGSSGSVSKSIRSKVSQRGPSVEF